MNKIDLKNALEKMKVALFGKQNYEAFSASQLQISELVVGGKVEIVGADGTLSDATDGEYKLDDSTVITVKDGLIDTIVEPAKEDETPADEDVKAEDEAPQEDTPADTPAESVDDVQKEVESVKDEVEALKVEIKELKNDISEFSKVIVKMSSHIQVLAKIPAETSKTSKDAFARNSEEAKINNLKRLFGK